MIRSVGGAEIGGDSVVLCLYNFSETVQVLRMPSTRTCCSSMRYRLLPDGGAHACGCSHVLLEVGLLVYET